MKLARGGCKRKMKKNNKYGNFFGYKNDIDFAIETLPDKRLKETIKTCNRNGVFVKRFYLAVEFRELSSISLIITKSNENRIFNIIKKLENSHLLKSSFIYNESEDIELIRLFANKFNKEDVFDIICKASSKKEKFDNLSVQLKEIYKMHKTMTNESISHQIEYNSGRIFYSATIKNIESFFDYGADRVRKIYKKYLWESNDSMNNVNFRYRLRGKVGMYNKMKKINEKLNEEFKWQEKEFEALSAKYRWNLNDYNSDMFSRLAKVRDENEL